VAAKIKNTSSENQASLKGNARATGHVSGRKWRHQAEQGEESMSIMSTFRAQSAPRGLAIALHCSGAGAGQWRGLRDMLGTHYELVAPEHYGCESTGPWTGDHAFTLADEAARTIALIDGAYGKVHLVGHSYGGAVALHAALARPDRIASLTLYEPSAFHLLKQFAGGVAAFAEISALAGSTGESVISGDYRGAAARFVDYWSGPGAWEALRPSHQAALTRWVSKAPLDFGALIQEPTPASAYADLRFPVLVLRGEHAPAPTRVIAHRLATLCPAVRLAIVAGAGHMGPLTHAVAVHALMVEHIAEARALAPQQRRHAPNAGFSARRQAGFDVRLAADAPA
jgi:pimeloyl-ACP methyl ester carboxylesterase